MLRVRSCTSIDAQTYVAVYTDGRVGTGGEVPALHGIFTGASRQVYETRGCFGKKTLHHNEVERRAKKVVAYLEPEEFSTAWVGNKAIYRTRMMIEDGGELLVIAPGIKGFGENPEVDGLIRRYGYRGTPYTMELMEKGVFPALPWYRPT